MARKPIDLTRAQTAFAGSGGKASADYLIGIQGVDQQAASTSAQAQTNYVNAMNDPTVLARRLAGARKTPPGKWLAKATTLGAPRLATGIAAAGPDWNSGFAPSASLIDSFPFKPKTNDAQTNYDNNATALGVALQNAARARKAAGG